MRTTTAPRPALSAPEEDAAATLAQAWLPLDSAGALPVDPFQIAWRIGVEVYGRSMRGWLGSLTVVPGATPILRFEDREQLPTIVFTCAHLLGHYVGRVAAGDTEFTLRDGRRELALDSDPDERYANRFAEALLMPAEAITAAGTLNPALLAARFEVPPDRMIARLTTLGLR